MSEWDTRIIFNIQSRSSSSSGSQFSNLPRSSIGSPDALTPFASFEALQLGSAHRDEEIQCNPTGERPIAWAFPPGSPRLRASKWRPPIPHKKPFQLLVVGCSLAVRKATTWSLPSSRWRAVHVQGAIWGQLTLTQQHQQKCLSNTDQLHVQLISTPLSQFLVYKNHDDWTTRTNKKRTFEMSTNQGAPALNPTKSKSPHELQDVQPLLHYPPSSCQRMMTVQFASSLFMVDMSIVLTFENIPIHMTTVQPAVDVNSSTNHRTSSFNKAKNLTTLKICCRDMGIEYRYPLSIRMYRSLLIRVIFLNYRPRDAWLWYMFTWGMIGTRFSRL